MQAKSSQLKPSCRHLNMRFLMKIGSKLKHLKLDQEPWRKIENEGSLNPLNLWSKAWWSGGLGNCTVCKTFAVQIFLWKLEFVIHYNFQPRHTQSLKLGSNLKYLNNQIHYYGRRKCCGLFLIVLLLNAYFIFPVKL